MFKNKTMNIKIIFKNIKNMLKYFMFSKHLFYKTLKKQISKIVFKNYFRNYFSNRV